MFPEGFRNGIKQQQLYPLIQTPLHDSDSCWIYFAADDVKTVGHSAAAVAQQVKTCLSVTRQKLDIDSFLESAHIWLNKLRLVVAS